MLAEEYLVAHRQELLRIFSEVYSGRSMELAINPKLNSDNLDKECSVDAVIIHLHHKGNVDFPVDYPEKLSDFEEALAIELYTIVLCEDGVQNGDLIRQGSRYVPNNKETLCHIKKYGKYVIIN